MGNLCAEVAERLVKDQTENDRMAKTLHVSLSQDNSGHASRCGPLYSYDPVKMTKQVPFVFNQNKLNYFVKNVKDIFFKN